MVALAINKAYGKLMVTCCSVSVKEHIGVVEVLKAAQSWVRRSPRYDYLVGKSPEVKDDWLLSSTRYAKTRLVFVASNLDIRFGLNLRDIETSTPNSSSSGRIPVGKHARVGPSSGPSA